MFYRSPEIAITITLFFAGLFGLLLLILSFNVLRHSVCTGKAGLGNDVGFDRALRVQGNFIEYVPMGLLLLLMLELSRAPSLITFALGSCLLVARMLHAYAMLDASPTSWARVIGQQLTFLMIGLSSMAAMYFTYTGKMVN